MTYVVRRESALPQRPAGLGDGWGGLLADLNRTLWRLDPPARAAVSLQDTGAGAIVLYDPLRRPETRRLCARVEHLLGCTCERCGEVGTVRAGCVLRVLCDACAAR
jgi:hypothetical protein